VSHRHFGGVCGLGYYVRKAKSPLLLIIARLQEAMRAKRGSPCEYPIGRNGKSKGPGKTNHSRKPLNIPVINICDALQACFSIAAAARKLKCRRGYIHKELAKYGVTPEDVIKDRWQPPS